MAALVQQSRMILGLNNNAGMQETLGATVVAGAGKGTIIAVPMVQVAHTPFQERFALGKSVGYAPDL